MLGKIRLIVVGVAALIVALTVGSMLAYGTIDPCRMLAREMADDAVTGLSETLGGADDTLGGFSDTLERTYRMITSQYSTGDCIKRLGRRWWDKL